MKLLKILIFCYIQFPFLDSECSAQNIRRLTFLTQPPDIPDNQNLPPIQVAVVDADGNIITEASDTISLALQSLSGNAVLLGGTTSTAVNGVAEFSELSTSGAGTFRLVAHKPIRLISRWSEEGTYNPDFPIYTDVWGEGAFAYVGRWQPGGVSIIDLSNPEKPALAHHWHPEGPNNLYKDIKTQNGIGYFASDNGGGVTIVDLTDPYNPVDLAVITSQHEGYDNVHNLFIDGDFLYLASSRVPQFAVFNVSNPSRSVFIRKISSNYLPPIHDITVQGGLLFTSSLGQSRGYTEIFDVSAIEETYTRLGGFESGVSTHSNWPTDNLHYLAISLESEGETVSIWDVSNPAQPSPVQTLSPLSLDTPPFSPHNPVIADDRLYVAWYQAGLQVYDISDPENTRLVGFYDTYPQPGSSGFNGDWGVYPFFGANLVLASDTRNGLFILDTSSADTEIVLSNSFQVASTASIPQPFWLMQ
jgi:choice-of-anchor B domain-containing protein